MTSLESKIKEALLREKRLSEATSKWTAESHPNIYELEQFLTKSGYRLIDVEKYKDGKVEIFLEPLKKGHLYPGIHHDTLDGKFYIDIDKYGLLNATEVEEILKGYQNALGVVHHLDALPKDKLEAVAEED